jgi:hypothetical protein
MRLLGFLLLLVAATAAAEPLGSIVGLIKTDQGRPAANVTVSTMGGDVYTLTGTDGRFVLAGIPVGGQKIRIHAEGRTDFELPVPVSEGENLVGTITLQPELPTIHGDAGLVVAKRVKPSELRFGFGVNCAADRADSVLASGTYSLEPDSTNAARLLLVYRPVHALKRLAILILDAEGRPIRRLREGKVGQASSVAWDGHDDAGHDRTPGAYRARFATPADSVDIAFCRKSPEAP